MEKSSLITTETESIKANVKVSATVSGSSKQWPFWPSFLVLFPILVGLTLTSSHLHYTLPKPQGALYKDGVAVFSEAQAMKYIYALSQHEGSGYPKYRIVGTEEMVEGEKYIMDVVEKIKAETALAGVHEVEIWHQVGSGNHLFDFMGKMVWKKYYNITNVIVRLSSSEESKTNAILVNAHSDSTLPSPGASDDLFGCATMLEALRVMAMSPRKLTNSVVFLFNGAEESLQDASHLFITQHPLKDTIRAVINIEACGVGGPEIVFQATSEEMIRALAYTPRPYGNVLATEIFSTGIISSDTDFRQFSDYGNLSGLDMALVQNSYWYHTRLDLAENVEPGALQHTGENTLSLLEYLTSNKTTMGNSPTAVPLPKCGSSDLIFFSGLGGHLFVVYTRAQATIIYSALASVAALVVTDRVDWSRKRLYFAGFLSVPASIVASFVGANLAAYVTAVLMDKTLTWFRHEAFPILVYGPPAALAAVLVQRTLSNFVRTPYAPPSLAVEESAMLEHATLMGQAVFYSTVTLVGHSFGVGSSYLSALSATAALVAVLVNDYILKRDSRTLHLATYVIGQITPLLLGIEGLVGFLDLFVPLTGRMGAEAPADFIIASLVTGIGFLCVPMILPFSHRYGATLTSRIALFLTFVTAATLGWFTRPGWNVYDLKHPKRLILLHMENTTRVPPTFELHVGSVDGAPFYNDVVTWTSALAAGNSLPESLSADDYSSDWDIIFPVSQLITTYKIALPPIPSTYSTQWNSFKVYAEKNVLNSVLRTRSFEIVMDHPGLIWPVIAFSADVISWDLPEPPERGVIRHHVKSVAAFGVSRFALSLVIRLSEADWATAVRHDQRAKGQRAVDDVDTDTDTLAGSGQKLGFLRVDYSGLDEKGMLPASLHHAGDTVHRPGMDFFAVLEKRLPPEVDACLLSAVAGVAFV